MGGMVQWVGFSSLSQGLVDFFFFFLILFLTLSPALLQQIASPFTFSNDHHRMGELFWCPKCNDEFARNVIY